jgi:hypothetical protein
MADEFRVIRADEMETTPRGRKSQAQPELVAALRKLPVGSALRLDTYSVSGKGDAKKVRTARTRVSARIRAAAKVARVSVRIHWSPAGVPQVVIAPAE